MNDYYSLTFLDPIIGVVSLLEFDISLSVRTCLRHVDGRAVAVVDAEPVEHPRALFRVAAHVLPQEGAVLRARPVVQLHTVAPAHDGPAQVRLAWPFRKVHKRIRVQ